MKRRGCSNVSRARRALATSSGTASSAARHARRERPRGDADGHHGKRRRRPARDRAGPPRRRPRRTTRLRLPTSRSWWKSGIALTTASAMISSPARATRRNAPHETRAGVQVEAAEHHPRAVRRARSPLRRARDTTSGSAAPRRRSRPRRRAARTRGSASRRAASGRCRPRARRRTRRRRSRTPPPGSAGRSAGLNTRSVPIARVEVLVERLDADDREHDAASPLQNTAASKRPSTDVRPRRAEQVGQQARVEEEAVADEAAARAAAAAPARRSVPPGSASRSQVHPLVQRGRPARDRRRARRRTARPAGPATRAGSSPRCRRAAGVRRSPQTNGSALMSLTRPFGSTISSAAGCCSR